MIMVRILEGFLWWVFVKKHEKILKRRFWWEFYENSCENPVRKSEKILMKSYANYEETLEKFMRRILRGPWLESGKDSDENLEILTIRIEGIFHGNSETMLLLNTERILIRAVKRKILIRILRGLMSILKWLW